MVNRSRRHVLKAGLAGLAAAGSAGVRLAQAQTSSPPASSARLSGPLFFDVETTHGVVRGIANTGINSSACTKG